jgi:hypothetical protein
MSSETLYGDFLCLVKKHFEHDKNFDIKLYIGRKLQHAEIFDISDILPGSELIAEQSRYEFGVYCIEIKGQQLYKYADKIIMFNFESGDFESELRYTRRYLIENIYDNMIDFLNSCTSVINKDEFDIHKTKLPKLGYSDRTFLNKHSELSTIMDVFKGLYGDDGNRRAIEYICTQYEFGG